MRTKGSIYITWIVVGVVLVGGVVLIVNGKGQRQKELANKYQDVKEETPTSSSNTNSNTIATGPYYTSGGNEQENDSFFVKGRVASLADIADKDKKATVVWFSAPWCEVCHAMRPFVGKSVNKFSDKLAIKEIDFDSNPHLGSQFGLYGTPDFVVVDQSGTEIKRWGGATQSNFEAQLQAVSQL